LAQDDYYYEIQLTNKQLVFYFMAGATGLILSFLAGVMVGKGVDATSGEVQAARPVVEERIVAEEPLAHATTPPPAEELTYAQRLEGERTEEATLEAKPRAGAPAARATKPAPAPTPKASAPSAKATAAPAPVRVADASPSGTLPPATARPAPAAATAKAEPAPAKPTPAPALAKPTPAPATTKATPKPAAKTQAPAASPSSFTIQVGAFKDKATADSVVARLKTKGFAAYLLAPESAGAGLFNVRVGSYPARADAERVQAKLRDQEKFKPFIVKN
jgi:cell division septation protein DedD